MSSSFDTKRVLIFLAFAFGIAWAIGLIVYLTGGLVNSPQLTPGLSLAVVLIATGYMWAPALAHLLTRWVTKEGWQGLFLQPRFRQGWPYWLAAWVVPALMTILGCLVFFAVFPQYYDPELNIVRQLLARAGQEGAVSPWVVVVSQTVQAILIAPIINGLFTFGEEFGWRAYLQPKLMALGGRRAVLILGVIWGAWHWPIIAMGHNYGLGYPGAPWLGMLAMVWFTFTIGVFLGWATLRSGSVWPAVIGHAAINGITALGVLLVKGEPSTLLGPMATGVVGGAAWAALALILYLVPGALRAPAPQPAVLPAAAPAPALDAGGPLPERPLSAKELTEKLDDSRYTH